MKEEILTKLKNLKTLYKSNGFIIVGVFGSYARDEQTKDSDIDLVYELDKQFTSKYGGWGSILELEKIKENIKQVLHVSRVDLATYDTNSKTLLKTIKEELVYV